MALLALGCTHPRAADPQPPTARIIVKFDDAAHTPPDALRVSIPAGTLLVLHHERGMSGGAHLYTGRMNGKQRAAVIEELSRRPDVDYAQTDHRLHY